MSAMGLGQKKLILGFGRTNLRTIESSYVQLYFTRGSEVVNLYSGSHPRIIINESDIAFTLEYDAKSETLDLFSVIERRIFAEVERLLEESHVQLERGAPRHTDEATYYRISVRQEHEVQGLKFDDNACVHDSWFVGRTTVSL